jgi:hypothetical protein
LKSCYYRCHKRLWSRNEYDKSGMEFCEHEFEGEWRLMKRPEMTAQVT